MIEFKYNKATGQLEAWKNGKKVGEIHAINESVEMSDHG